MLPQIIPTLVASKNSAADEVLLDVLHLGNNREQKIALDALLARRTLRGLGSVVVMYSSLTEDLQQQILQQIKAFHAALREYGHSEDLSKRLAAIRLIRLSHEGKLAYVLNNSIHHHDEQISQAGTAALISLSRWIISNTRSLQNDTRKDQDGNEQQTMPSNTTLYQTILECRSDVEQTLSHAIDVHRGKFGAELIHAALMLVDSPKSQAISILRLNRHGGQQLIARRLQQPPKSEHVAAFLLGAAYGGLRSHFGIAFSHINETPSLDAILNQTHWLKDSQLQLCMRQVNRGVWFTPQAFQSYLEHTDPVRSASAAMWLAHSGAQDSVVDEALGQIYQHAGEHLDARLMVLRAAAHRPDEASTATFAKLLQDPDERIARMAVREIIRRRPRTMEAMLVPLMAKAPESVRKVISRAIGQAGYSQFWNRFEQLDTTTRQNAGRAMFKILPDAITRLSRQLTGGSAEQRLKAMQIAREIGLGERILPILIQICRDPDPRLRSKVVKLLGDVESVPIELLADRLAHDADARVRANAVESLEARHADQCADILTQKATTGHNRERANAIKAIHNLKITEAAAHLTSMLNDPRPEHRISAIWAMRQTGIWQLLDQIGHMARQDNNGRVRRYALAAIRETIKDIREKRKAA